MAAVVRKKTKESDPVTHPVTHSVTHPVTHPVTQPEGAVPGPSLLLDGKVVVGSGLPVSSANPDCVSHTQEGNDGLSNLNRSSSARHGEFDSWRLMIDPMMTEYRIQRCGARSELSSSLASSLKYR